MNSHLMGLVLVTAMMGCSPDPISNPALNHYVFDRPQAVLFVGDTLLVSETGYGPQGWRQGHVSAIDVSTAQLIGRWQTTQLNPQGLHLHEDSVFVINSGSFDFSDFNAPRAVTAGGVDVLAAANIRTEEPDIDNWPLPVPDSPSSPSAPIDMSIAGDRILMTSALKSSVWFADHLNQPPQFEDLIIDPMNESGLGAVAAWGEGFVVVDFNSDRLSLVDSNGTVASCHKQLGGQEITIEGAQSPIVDGDTLYVLMSLSGRVLAVDLKTLSEDCSTQPRVVIPSTGQIPNDMHLHEGSLFIVHSGDNNIISYDRETGQELQRWILPVGSNPWHVAFDSTGEYMAVSEWGANAVSIINMQSGLIRRVVQAAQVQ